jgi:UMF2 family putative MFS family transporter
MLLTVSLSALNTLVPLWLQHALSTWQIGCVGSAYFCGNLLGIWLAGRVIHRYGFTCCYLFSCLVFAASTAGQGYVESASGWIICRFLSGAACALIWVVVESALLHSAAVNIRGRLLAAYMTIYYLGTVFGQLLLGRLPTAISSVLPWACGLIVLAMLPLLISPIRAKAAGQVNYTLWPMFIRRDTRLGLQGCVLSGMVLGVLYGLLPLFLAHKGLTDGSVGNWMAMLVFSAILGQWPVGRLAEKVGRRAVLCGQALLLVLCGICLIENVMTAPALFVLGAAGFTLYPVAMSWACEKVTSSELVVMNQVLLMSYTLGSLSAPVITAMLMSRFNDNWLFIIIALVSALYLLLLVRDAQAVTRTMTAG